MKEIIKSLFDKTFLKYFLVGIVNTIIGSTVMFVFYNVFHLGYWISSASNYIFGSISSYLLNRQFTFRSNAYAGKTLLRFVFHILSCYFIAYGIAKPLTRFLLEGCGKTIQENIAMVVGLGLFVVLNYLGQRLFVFRKKLDK